jgi:hypothetical protein
MEDALHLEEIFQIIMLKITPNLFWGKIRERLPCRGGGTSQYFPDWDRSQRRTRIS